MNSFDKVYKLVSIIPKGKVATYKQISDITGLSPRVVGFALHANKNPETVPCHRVVNIKGELAKGYAFGGEKAQRRKLENERVAFLNDTVDLSKYQHQFAN
ncbi:MAG: MGMT family protein [Candidatus Levyibacteriota bacterium]